MKTIAMTKTYNFRAGPRVSVKYEAGKTYKRVPEMAARAIVSAAAGRVIKDRKDD